jgi:hypothetical protein
MGGKHLLCYVCLEGTNLNHWTSDRWDSDNPEYYNEWYYNISPCLHHPVVAGTLTSYEAVNKSITFRWTCCNSWKFNLIMVPSDYICYSVHRHIFVVEIVNAVWNLPVCHSFSLHLFAVQDKLIVTLRSTRGENLYKILVGKTETMISL